MRPTHRCIRLSDFVGWLCLSHGKWYANVDTGKVFVTQTGKEVKFRRSKRGYLSVHVRFRNQTLEVFQHHLIWIAAHGMPVDNLLMTIDHINGCCSDNRIENLQLLTLEENIWKGLRKLSDEDVREIRRLSMGEAKCSELALRFGVSQRTIYNVVRKFTYRDVVDDE